jgi:hypothetical protein
MSVYGIIAEFKNPGDLLKAAKATQTEGFKKYDAFSPFPIHGMDDAMSLEGSKLGWIVLCGGAFGLSLGLGLQAWVATTAYPLVISGKPLFSYQAFVPVTFELMILFSAFSAVFGMFALNKLPEHYHPLFTSKNFAKVTSHGFFIGIEANDEKFDVKASADFLKKIGGENIEVIED